MAPRTSLQTIPTELFELILHNLPLSGINGLARTSHRFYELLNPCLYSLQSHVPHGAADILIWAAKRGRVATAKYIMQTSTNNIHETSLLANCTDRRYQLSALSWAAAKGHEEFVDLLLSTPGINVDPRNRFNRSPLSHAAQNGHVGVVRLLLEKAGTGIDVDSMDTEYKQTPLLWAMESYALPEGHDKDCLGIEFGEDDCPWSLSRMLYWNIERYQKRIREGGPRFQHCSCQDTAYERAKERWNSSSTCEEITRVLLDHGAEIEAYADRYTPLTAAVATGSIRLARLLLDRGADHNCKWFNSGPLQRAARSGDVEMVNLLLEAGAGSQFPALVYPLMRAAAWDHIPVLKILLTHGSDSIESDSEFMPVLESATRRGHIEATGLLLKFHQRMWPDQRPNELILWWIAYAGWGAIFKMLLDAGTPLVGSGGTPVREEVTLLAAAVIGQDMDIIKSVLTAVDINEEDRRGWNAMKWALFMGGSEVVDLLSEHGAVAPREEIDLKTLHPEHSMFYQSSHLWADSSSSEDSYPLSFGGAGDKEDEPERQVFDGWGRARLVLGSSLNTVEAIEIPR